ncbi:CoA transferase subunit A [Rhodococcus sp. Eu-32]|uniref:CoA transferase subunit A n=1 Tax=Rhodococcus sp. Eu-32 TaxID=1017319 RepID=UPI000DF46AC7|nr:CoA-transferase [Rhodococcus sp. Eu-32]RRQ27232.1 CoA transferase subunit A [Rhodococcus sp. Eu-32]
MAVPTRRDKTTTLDELVAELSDGMTVGFGGWGSRRKPMAAVQAILRSDLKDLTVVSYGGPDVGMLCAAEKVRRVVFGFVSLDSVPYDPWFARARTSGRIEVRELDEGMLNAGLRAAAARLPFLPIRAGLGSDVMAYYPELRTVLSPYPIPGTSTHEELVAMPALNLDAAFVHLNLADASGNGAYLGPDPYFDDLYLLASERRYLTCERVVSTADLVDAVPPQALLTNRMMVDAVVEVPGGARFTSCVPDYGRDEETQKDYVRAASDVAEGRRFVERFAHGVDARQEAVR